MSKTFLNALEEISQLMKFASGIIISLAFFMISCNLTYNKQLDQIFLSADNNREVLERVLKALPKRS